MHPTRRAILDVLKRKGRGSLRELAADLDLVPVTLRSHLLSLETNGLVVKSGVRGQRGRPYHVYALTTDAEERVFPKQYDDLALQLMNGVSQMEQEGLLQSFVERVAENMAAARRFRIEGKSTKQRIAEVVRIVEEMGGDAELTETEDGYLVREHNCPYLRVSRQSSHVCEIERRLVSKLVGGPVELGAHRLRNGATSCSFTIPRSCAS